MPKRIFRFAFIIRKTLGDLLDWSVNAYAHRPSSCMDEAAMPARLLIEKARGCGDWVAFHGKAARRGVTSVWARRELVSKVKWVDATTKRTAIVYNWDGFDGLICIVYLPTHGRALTEFDESLEALEIVPTAAPQVACMCAEVDFNTVCGSWLSDGDIFGEGL